MTGVDVSWLQHLVASPTVSRDRRAQRELIRGVLDRLRGPASQGRVTADLDGAHPWALVDPDVAPDRPRLLFVVHVDTVPTGDVSGWSRDPFGGELHEGVVHGRGAADMKGGLVAAVAVVEATAEDGVPVALLLTSDEEVGSLGARAAAPALGDVSVGAVLVPEPTAGRVHLGHRGALWLELRTAGVAAHGSTPDRGVNAILRAAALLQRAAEALPLADDPFLGRETWNVGLVSGGAAPNIVPDEARFTVDHRTTGGGGELLAWWQEQPETAGARVEVALDAVRTSAAAPWVRSLPVPAAEKPVPFFTDASALVPVLRGAPVVIWGPGQPAAMHAVDESIAVAEVETAATVYADVVRAWGSAAGRRPPG